MAELDRFVITRASRVVNTQCGQELLRLRSQRAPATSRTTTTIAMMSVGATWKSELATSLPVRQANPLIRVSMKDDPWPLWPPV